MARVHFWSHLVDDEGIPIQGANITIYLSESLSPAFVYSSETTTTATNTSPQTTTNSEGFFEFWIGDVSESYGYSIPQKFKITWEKTGVAEGYIDYVDILPPATRFYNTTISTWTSGATGVYADVVHSMKTLYPLVQLYDTNYEQVTNWWKIESQSTITTRVYFMTNPGTLYISVVG
jgi:hypothetical protein